MLECIQCIYIVIYIVSVACWNHARDKTSWIVSRIEVAACPVFANDTCVTSSEAILYFLLLTSFTPGFVWLTTIKIHYVILIWIAYPSVFIAFELAQPFWRFCIQTNRQIVFFYTYTLNFIKYYLKAFTKQFNNSTIIYGN